MKLLDEKFFLFRLLRKIPVPGQLNLLIALVAITIPLSLGGFWFGMETLSAARAYVAAESLWSKAQKDAVYSLIKSVVGNEQEYDNFLNHLKIPLGDKMARIELEKDDPDMDIVYKGLIEGGNDPADVPGMARLFRQFRHYNYVDRAVTYWAQGDAYIDELRVLGEELRVTTSRKPTTEQEKLQQTAAIAVIVARVDAINNDLTGLETNFAATLNEASRRVKNIILLVLIATIILVGIIFTGIAIFLSKIIARVDRAKSEFVSLASHQLRTPLTIMNWYSEKLIRDFSQLSDERRIHYIQALMDASQRMGNLVDSLLSASQIEIGAFAMNPTQVDIAAITGRVVKDLMPHIKKKNIRVGFKRHTDFPPIFVDARLIEMILQNLISNAVKYTPDNGHVKVTLSPQKSNILIKVEDNGFGISIPEQPRVFDRLFRTRNAQEQTPSGTGLGLYITKLAVERCGGKIWLHSSEGKGTTFYVTIPKDKR